MDNQLIMELQEKYALSNQLEEQFNIVEQQVGELESFSLHLEELDSSNENDILASLGKGVYIPAVLKEKELYVSVGSGILVKKKPSEAKDVVSGQLKGLIKMREDLANKIEEINAGMKDMMGKIESQDPAKSKSS